MKKNLFLILFVLSACTQKRSVVTTAEKTDLLDNEVELSAQQVLLGNITTDTVGRGSITIDQVLPATLNFDQSKLHLVTSRIMGRVQKLYYKNVGDYVKSGATIYDIYSEELNNAKQEYLLALEKQRSLEGSVINIPSLVDAAKNKLLLWGMTNEQIERLRSTGKVEPYTPVYSKAGGYVSSLEISEGDYVMEGGVIMKLADLSTLWVETQIYNSQLNKFSNKRDVLVSIPSFPALKLKGRIEFLNPELSNDSRIILARITIPNFHNDLKPGMSAYVNVLDKQSAVLTVPADAVIRDGKASWVWIKTGENIFANKMVVTGEESADRIEIRQGLDEGHIVVVTGAYLINSEYIFKKGENPMAGHDMKNM